MIHYIEGNQLVDEVSNCEHLVIAIFAIPDSIPCEKQYETLREIEKKYGEAISVFKIAPSDSQDIQIRYHISSFPTLLFFQEGKEMERCVGLTELQEIEKIVLNTI